MRKKADLSLNTIVVAAIGLTVMVILIVMFIGKARLFGKGVSSCTEKGGECVAGFTVCLNTGGVTISGTDCDDSGQVCCYKKPVQPASQGG